MTMRPLIALLLLPLAACSGFGHFLGDTVWIDTNRNAPKADSENNRRAQGEQVQVAPLRAEPGDVWPSGPIIPPTLEDIENHPDAYPLPRLELGTNAPHAQPRPASGAAPTNHLPSVRSTRLPNRRNQPAPADANDQAIGGKGDNLKVIPGPNGSGSVVIPNGNGTSTVIAPNGQVSTIPTPR